MRPDGSIKILWYLPQSYKATSRGGFSRHQGVRSLSSLWRSLCALGVATAVLFSGTFATAGLVLWWPETQTVPGDLQGRRALQGEEGAEEVLRFRILARASRGHRG